MIKNGSFNFAWKDGNKLLLNFGRVGSNLDLENLRIIKKHILKNNNELENILKEKINEVNVEEMKKGK